MNQNTSALFYHGFALSKVGKLLVFLAEYSAAWKFQAYYGAGAIPPPYFNPAVASGHAAHPYMWAPPQVVFLNLHILLPEHDLQYMQSRILT